MKVLDYDFSKREIGFVIIILILVLACGVYAWNVSSRDQVAEASINSFEECVAAGNPVMESYPEQCAANGQTFTNPNQSAIAPPVADETAGWLPYNSAKNTYSVRVPDGWDLVTIDDTENLYSHSGDITYAAGTPATVKVVEGGWDGASSFSLYVPGAYYDQIVKEGTKQGEVVTTAGLTAEKYYFVQETEPEAIGYAKGAKVYNYYFAADGKYIQLQHVADPGQPDEHERVEQMLKTLVIN